jgi:hypothetical protein
LPPASYDVKSGITSKRARRNAESQSNLRKWNPGPALARKKSPVFLVDTPIFAKICSVARSHTHMKPAPVSPPPKKVNWIRLPDPVTEEQVNIQLSWTNDWTVEEKGQIR